MQVYTFITEHFIAFEVDAWSVVYCDCPRTLSWFHGLPDRVPRGRVTDLSKAKQRNSNSPAAESESETAGAFR